MSRYDKVHFIARAPAGTALPGGGTAFGVRLAAGGSLFLSGTALLERADGVICLAATGGAAAGDIIGYLKKGEIVEFPGTASGTTIFAGAGGVLSTTSTDAQKVGKTVEASRLVVDL